MKYILSLLIILSSLTAIGQGTPTYQGNSTSITYNRGTVGALRMQLLPRGFYPFPTFDTLGTVWVDSAGRKDLYYHNGTARIRIASVTYVDSVALSIEAGSVDSSIYSTVTRLADSLHDLRDYVDSNNAIIYSNIATLQSDVVTIDSAVGVAFGAISALYDTLPNYVDTAMLNDSLQAVKALINLKQNYSDTTTWDATRYWVSTQIPSLSGYVPYTGATGNVDIGTHTFTAKDGVFNHSSGSGVALSVTKGGSGEALTVNKTSGSGNAMSVTGGVTQLSELHTTTPIADAYIASAATWNAKGNGTVTSIQLVGGTNVTITPTTAITTSGVYTISATGGGGGSPVLGTPYHLLFPTGTDTLKTTDKAYIDTTDNRLVFANDTTTTAVNTDPNGGTKVFGSNRMGMAALRLLDTVSIPAALQRAINAQTVGTIFPLGGTVAYTGMFQQGTSGMFQVQVATNVAYGGTYDAVNQQQNYTKVLYSTSTAANNVFFLRTVSLTVGAGIMAGATANSGGSGRGTFTFALPAYNSGQRIFVGYSTSLSAIMTTNDPSAAASIAMLALAKDAGDTTLSWLYNDGTGTPIKVSTGITPNQNDVYRLTVYVSPKGRCYMQLEVMNKTSNTVLVINPTTDIPSGVKIVPQQSISNASTGAVCTYGLIQFIEEIY